MPAPLSKKARRLAAQLSVAFITLAGLIVTLACLPPELTALPLAETAIHDEPDPPAAPVLKGVRAR